MPAENESGQEKTEEPSARRRQESRQEGNVAKSSELNSAAIILAGTSFLYFAGGHILQNIIILFKSYLKNATVYEITEEEIRPFFYHLAEQMLPILGPFLLLMVVIGLTINISQVGFLWAPKSVAPKLEKLNVISGIKRMFAMKAFVELAKNLLRIAIITAIIYFSIKTKYLSFFLLMNETAGNIVNFLAEISGEILLKVGFALLALALADFAYQRYEHEKNLKMTKQEAKEEMKMSDGNPQVKARIREIQRTMSRKRMMASVPEADVVITNPTHFAVALKYNPAESTAPVILAKGERKVALKIKELAKEHNIPTVEDPPLARLLFHEGEVGREIPIDAYEAVAEVLSYVYKLQNRRLNERMN